MRKLRLSEVRDVVVDGDLNWGWWDSMVGVPELPPVTTYHTPERFSE